MPRNNQRGAKNNNPQGRNQHSNGWMDMARERPAATAAAAAGAVAAGVFLWSKRSQISDQLGQLSDQIGEWTENISSERELETVGGDGNFSGLTGSGATGDFDATPASTTPKTTARSARPTSSGRRGAISGSGTMSGGSLDTGPSGRGRA